MNTPEGSRLPHLLAGALTVLILAPIGCAGRYGSIRLDAGIGRVCEGGQVLPGHRYYITGAELAPDAILALRDDRPLRGDLWREVPVTREVLARFASGMRGGRDDGPYGSAVLDDRGARIGIWCSFLRPLPVTLLEDGGVIVSPPLPEPGDPAAWRGLGVD